MPVPLRERSHHEQLDELAPFTLAHLERWLDLFHETIEGGWEGPEARRAVALAHKVARVHSRQLVGEEVKV